MSRSGGADGCCFKRDPGGRDTQLAPVVIEDQIRLVVPTTFIPESTWLGVVSLNFHTVWSALATSNPDALQ